MAATQWVWPTQLWPTHHLGPSLVSADFAADFSWPRSMFMLPFLAKEALRYGPLSSLIGDSEIIVGLFEVLVDLKSDTFAICSAYDLYEPCRLRQPAQVPVAL